MALILPLTAAKCKEDFSCCFHNLIVVNQSLTFALFTTKNNRIGKPFYIKHRFPLVLFPYKELLVSLQHIPLIWLKTFKNCLIYIVFMLLTVILRMDNESNNKIGDGNFISKEILGNRLEKRIILHQTTSLFFLPSVIA